MFILIFNHLVKASNCGRINWDKRQLEWDKLLLEDDEEQEAERKRKQEAEAKVTMRIQLKKESIEEAEAAVADNVKAEDEEGQIAKAVPAFQDVKTEMTGLTGGSSSSQDKPAVKAEEASGIGHSGRKRKRVLRKDKIQMIKKEEAGDDNDDNME